MVQWTERPAAKPQVSAPKQGEPNIAHRPLRKPQKRGLVVSLQVMSVCAVFGLIVASYFIYKETAATPAVASRPAQDGDLTTGRIVIMDQKNCRELGFDNQSGRTVQKGQVSCHDTPSYNGSATQSLYRHPTNRLEAVRKSFSQ